MIIIPNNNGFDNSESDNENLKERKKIAQKWHQQQQIEVQKIKQKTVARKNVKTVIVTLTIITLIAGFLPSIIDFGSQKFFDFFSDKNQLAINDNNSISENNQGNQIIKKLKEMQLKNQLKNCRDNKNIPCPYSNPNENKNLSNQIDKTIQNVDNHKNNLQKLIDISDNKHTIPSK